MPAQKLTDDQVRTALETLSGWALAEGKLQKKFEFRDFNAAFGFLTRVALHAERMNHHPEIHNVFKRVCIDLSTHDCSGISQLDVDLARKIDASV